MFKLLRPKCKPLSCSHYDLNVNKQQTHHPFPHCQPPIPPPRTRSAANKTKNGPGHTSATNLECGHHVHAEQMQVESQFKFPCLPPLPTNSVANEPLDSRGRRILEGRRRAEIHKDFVRILQTDFECTSLLTISLRALSDLCFKKQQYI